MKQFVDFSLHNRVKTIFGQNSLQQLPKLLVALGSQNPLVIMSNSASLLGTKELLLAEWGNGSESISAPSSKEFTIFTSYEISTDTVHSLAKKFPENAHDGIIAVGGGTVMDLAKSVKLALQNTHALGEAEEGYYLDDFHTLCPLIMIPTSIGSGSGASSIAYLNDRKRGRILRFEHLHLFPDVTILDPRMTKSVSPTQTVMGLAAILGRAMESLISTLSVPNTATYALRAIQLLQMHAFRVVHTPHDLEARQGIAIASQLAGFAASSTRGSLAHVSAIAIEKLVGIPYGQCMMILLPHTLRYHVQGNEQILAHIGRQLRIVTNSVPLKEDECEQDAKIVLEWISQFFDSLTKSLSSPIATRFYDLVSTDGKTRIVKPHQLEDFAIAIFNSVDMLTSHRITNTQDIIRVLEAAYWGYPLDQNMVRYKSRKE